MIMKQQSQNPQKSLNFHQESQETVTCQENDSLEEKK